MRRRQPHQASLRQRFIHSRRSLGTQRQMLQSSTCNRANAGSNRNGQWAGTRSGAIAPSQPSTRSRPNTRSTARSLHPSPSTNPILPEMSIFEAFREHLLLIRIAHRTLAVRWTECKCRRDIADYQANIVALNQATADFTIWRTSQEVQALPSSLRQASWTELLPCLNLNALRAQSACTQRCPETLWRVSHAYTHR